MNKDNYQKLLKVIYNIIQDIYKAATIIKT
jgi:hypothetical protein